MPIHTVRKVPRLLGAASLAAALALGGLYATSVTTQPANAQVSVTTPGAPTSFADLVDAVSPAVVSISVSMTHEVRQFGGPNFQFQFPDLPDDHPFREFFDQFGDQFGQRGMPNGPRTRQITAAGSGFVISEDGFIVTNDHVVQNADSVTVIFDDGTEQAATIVGTDSRTDLALLKIDGASNLTYLEFSDVDVRVGDWVVAVGNPFGLGGTVTAGIVSARGRDISRNSYGDYIQIDAAVNRGNSGGPAFNLSGQVVGVNTAIFSPNGGNVGIAFAIPAATVQQVIDDLKDDGLVQRGFLGVGIQDMDDLLAQSLGLDTNEGALVTLPTPGGPAEAIGIESGDVIVGVNGDAIDSSLDLTRTISRIDPGTPVSIDVIRDGERLSFDVTLATLNEEELVAQQQPAPQVEVPAPSSLGVLLMPNPDGEGVVIEEVERDSIAAELQLIPGDVILEAEHQAISTPADFERILADAMSADEQAITLKITRNGAVRFLGLPLSSEDMS